MDALRRSLRQGVPLPQGAIGQAPGKKSKPPQGIFGTLIEYRGRGLSRVRLDSGQEMLMLDHQFRGNPYTGARIRIELDFDHATPGARAIVL